MSGLPDQLRNVGTTLRGLVDRLQAPEDDWDRAAAAALESPLRLLINSLMDVLRDRTRGLILAHLQAATREWTPIGEIQQALASPPNCNDYEDAAVVAYQLGGLHCHGKVETRIGPDGFEFRLVPGMEPALPSGRGGAE